MKDLVIIETIRVNRQNHRNVYKRNTVNIFENVNIPFNVFKSISTQTVLDITMKKTPENLELLEKFNGVLDSDWGYCDEEYGIPVFQDSNDKTNDSMEIAIKFIDEGLSDEMKTNKVTAWTIEWN